jgi:hypothetical protein
MKSNSTLRRRSCTCGGVHRDVAFDHAHALLVEVAQASNGTLDGPLLTFAGPLLVLALRACADLAEQARTGRDGEALATAQQGAHQLYDLHHGMQPDPFTAGPLRPTAAGDHASWQAEGSRLRDEWDPWMWEQAGHRVGCADPTSSGRLRALAASRGTASSP